MRERLERDPVRLRAEGRGLAVVALGLACGRAVGAAVGLARLVSTAARPADVGIALLATFAGMIVGGLAGGLGMRAVYARLPPQPTWDELVRDHGPRAEPPAK